MDNGKNEQETNVDELKQDDIKRAYLKFKSYIYYDNTLQHVRMRLAEFENKYWENNKLDERFEELAKAIIDYKNEKPEELNKYLEDIDYIILPKSVEKPEYPANIYRNRTKFDKYVVKDYNVFIDCPIEIHLISILWIMKIGHKLDKELPDNVKGYRLVRNEYKCFEKDNKYRYRLFEKYHEKYMSFRDDAIKKATDLHEKGSDVILLNIDIHKFFYNILFDFKELSRYEEDELDKTLNAIMSEIHNKFQTLLKNDGIVDDIINKGVFKNAYANKIMDDKNIAEKKILPIGLLSSSIIANYVLKDFDEHVINKVKPEYYGRYVDDMLFVFSNMYVGALESDKSENSAENDENAEQLKIAKIVQSLINCSILCCKDHVENDGEYTSCIKENEIMVCKKGIDVGKKEWISYFKIKNELNNNTFLISSNKTKIFDFYKDEPIYLLEEYSKQITRNRSVFKTLPEDDDMSSTLGDSPIYIKYSSSSKNRLSSIDGHSLDHFKLSTNLSKNIIYRFLRAKLSKKDIGKYNQTIKYIFSSADVLEIIRLWEKIFTYYIISKNEKELVSAVKNLLDIISNIEFENENGNDEIIKKMKEDLRNYLSYSLAMAIGLNPKFYNEKLKKELKKLNKCAKLSKNEEELFKKAKYLIKSNLISNSM